MQAIHVRRGAAVLVVEDEARDIQRIGAYRGGGSIGDQPIWHGRIFIERLNDRGWGQVPILPGLGSQRFTSEQDALAAALAHGREYVDGILPR
jgi:hypothetical protein